MVKCSNCSEEGHNKRTCPLVKKDVSKELTNKNSKKVQDKIPKKVTDKVPDKVPDKVQNKIKKPAKKEKVIEEIKVEKIIWNQFKIENIPNTKKDATFLVKQIYLDWDILSKLAEEVHEYDEYYGSRPNEWRMKPEILIQEKKIDYLFLWNNYVEQYQHIVKCYDLYQKGEKILMKVF